MKCVGIILISSMLVASYDAATVTCRSDPTTDEDQQAVDDGDTFTLTCDLTNSGNNNNDHVESCSWNHYEPLNEDRGNTYVPDIECAYALSGQSSNCPSDTRITGTVNTGSCSIQVSNSKPEDTGVWEAKISTRLSNTKQVSSIDISTYNQSLVEILDDSENDRDATNSVRTKYNWNDKQEDWEDDESNWETVELICYAAGGRPIPKFTWQINGDDLSDDSHFDNEAARLDGAGTVYQSYGYKGAIQDMEAKLTFTVNTELLEVLNSRHNIDTNPENGDFDFDIDCIVEQDGIETAKETVRIDVQKSHDDGHLKGSMIGVIVGVVVAVIILVAAIALLIFAKSSAIWCFAEDDRNYKDPKASRPRGPGPQQPQQQRGRPR